MSYGEFDGVNANEQKKITKMRKKGKKREKKRKKGVKRMKRRKNFQSDKLN